MDIDCVVAAAAVVLQSAGWLCLVASRLAVNRRRAVVAESLLIVCMCGLGTAMLVSAAIRAGTALTCGAGVILLALVAIMHPRQAMLGDPYTLIYSSDQRG